MQVERESIEIQFNPTETPYEILGGKIFFHGEGWKSGWWGCMEFEDETRIIPPQSGDSPLGNGWNDDRAEELGDGRVRRNHDFQRKPKVGNYLIMRHSARDHSEIQLNGDIPLGIESGAVTDVTIRGNRFHPSCLTSWYQFGEGVISIYPIIPTVRPETPSTAISASKTITSTCSTTPSSTP